MLFKASVTIRMDIDLEHLLETIEINNVEEFRLVYEDLIKKKLESDALRREECWTEALSVGSREFVEKAQMLYRQRRYLYQEEAGIPGSDAWCVREESSS